MLLRKPNGSEIDLSSREMAALKLIAERSNIDVSALDNGSFEVSDPRGISSIVVTPQQIEEKLKQMGKEKTSMTNPMTLPNMEDSKLVELKNILSEHFEKNGVTVTRADKGFKDIQPNTVYRINRTADFIVGVGIDMEVYKGAKELIAQYQSQQQGAGKNESAGKVEGPQASRITAQREAAANKGSGEISR